LKTRLLQAEADLANGEASVRSIQAQIETARADVQAAKASVDKAKAQSTDAELNMTRNKELFAQGVVAAAVRDSAQANYDSARASVTVAEAQYEQAKTRVTSMQANLEQAKAQVQQRKAAAEMAKVDLSHTTIYAPIDGTVIARNVDVGQTVAASFQAPVLFVIAQDLTKMLVYTKTDEADVGKMRVGANASFRVDSFPREKFDGRVIQVRMNATTVQNVVTYDTIIEFENPEQKLFPGMTAYVTIPIAEAKDVVKVPNGALRFKPDLSDDEVKKLYAKYNISTEDPRARRLAGLSGSNGTGGGSARGVQAGASGAAGGGAQAGGGGRPTGGRADNGETAGSAGGAFGAGGGQRGAMGGGRRIETGIVWKSTGKKELQPMQVRLGVTDYTFTELKGGDLKPGDELIIGQSSTSGASQPGAGGAQRPGGPMGTPMGGMRRM
jgi:HlyD family secretion protein